MLTKQRIRSKILLRLKTQKEEDREKKSKAIRGKLFRTSVFKRAKRVMFYISFGGEVDTKEMIEEARRLGKIVAVPVCRKRGRIYPAVVEPKHALRKGRYGFHEPAVRKKLDLAKIDLVIVPGLAFDRRGNRLGRGHGCYDRLLEKVPRGSCTVGLAYDFQILPSIPSSSHDVSVKKVICN